MVIMPIVDLERGQNSDDVPQNSDDLPMFLTLSYTVIPPDHSRSNHFPIVKLAFG